MSESASEKMDEHSAKVKVLNFMSHTSHLTTNVFMH